MKCKIDGTEMERRTAADWPQPFYICPKCNARECAPHRECFPEQYAHPAVGKRMKFKGLGEAREVVRVVGSRFGQMAHMAKKPGETEEKIYLLSTLKEAR